MAHFEIFPDSEGKSRFRLRADNGEIVCQSEGYDSPGNAERGANDLVKAAKAAAGEGTGGLIFVNVEQVDA